MDIVGETTLREMRGAKWYNEWIYKNFIHYLKGEILEIGCGIGTFVNYLKKSGNVTSVDINKKYLRGLKDSITGVKFGYGDIENNDFFFKNKKFDSIISLNVFEHIKNDSKALRNTFDLLKPGGYFIILVPAHTFLFSQLDKSLGHYRRYSKYLLKQKLETSGFEVEKIKYFNWWGAVGWFVFVKLLKVKKMPGGPVGIFDLFGKYFLFAEKNISLPFGLSVVAICKK